MPLPAEDIVDLGTYTLARLEDYVATLTFVADGGTY